MNNKFSVSVPANEPVRKVYGYKNDNLIYWQSSNDRWFYFDTNSGATYKASTANNYQDKKYTPIYEPFSINIGM